MRDWTDRIPFIWALRRAQTLRKQAEGQCQRAQHERQIALQEKRLALAAYYNISRHALEQCKKHDNGGYEIRAIRTELEKRIKELDKLADTL